jgi:hypothetical protein
LPVRHINIQQPAAGHVVKTQVNFAQFAAVLNQEEKFP